MARAVWNGAVLAESEACEEVEGNLYFPTDALRAGHLEPSPTTTYCRWKGEANYYNVIVDGAVNADAAWTYRSPKPAASRVKDRVAFWRGVTVER